MISEVVKSKVEEFLDIQEALYKGAQERGLESVVNTDSLSKTAVSVYISTQPAKEYPNNGYKTSNRGRPAKTESGDKGVQEEAGNDGGDEEKLTGTIEKKKKDVKQGTKNGKKWKMTVYSFCIDGKWVNTTDGSIFKGKVFDEGDQVDYTVGVNQAGYPCLTGIELADGAVEAPDDSQIPF